MIVEMKPGDLLPERKVELTPPDLDLAGASVVFTMATRDGVVIIDKAAVQIVQTTAPAVVRYPWRPGDTDPGGTDRAEFKVVWPGTKPATFPNRGIISVVLRDGL